MGARGQRLSAAAGALIAIVIFAAIGAAGASAQSATGSPPGSNDFSCNPSKGHTRPVVLVHGTYGDQSSWNSVAPALAGRGYCVFSLDYGNRAQDPVADSAREVEAFIEKVIRRTGARKVAVVGHSQGGMLPRYIIKYLDGKRLISELVGLAPSNHGTDNPAAPIAAANGCDACGDQIAGSKFITRLNRGDETPGKISYTVIETRNDEVVTPYTSAFLAKGPKTTNILLQDKCPEDSIEHIAITFDPIALQWIENALRRKGRPASPGFEPTC